jgi:hypothetical protein
MLIKYEIEIKDKEIKREKEFMTKFRSWGLKHYYHHSKSDLADSTLIKYYHCHIDYVFEFYNQGKLGGILLRQYLHE